MLVKVFHHDPSAPQTEAVHVANIELPEQTDNRALATAWRFTNNIDGSWSRGPQCDWGQGMQDNSDYHPEVEVLVELPKHQGRVYGLRSSMIGDIFTIDDRSYRVASMGFTPMNVPAARKQRAERA